MKIAFYALMVLAMAGCLITVFIINADGTESVDKYPQLSPEARDAEYAALVKIVAQPVENGHHYFDILYRIYGLQQSCKRADREEHGDSQQRARWMVLQTQELANGWWHDNVPISRGDEFINAKNEFDHDPRDPLTNREPIHLDPRTLPLLYLFYFGSMLLVTIHYGIRLNGMGARIMPEFVSNWRFPFWVLLWPIGLFKYPTEINPLTQMKLVWKRVQGYAAFIVSAAMSMAAGVPVAAQESDENNHRQNHTLHVDVTTLTLPEYLGANGGVFHPAPVQQTSFTVLLPHGLYVGLWNSVPLGNRAKIPNFGSELDYSAGWNGTARHLNFNVDLSVFDITPISRFRGDVFRLSGTTSRPFKVGRRQSFEPFVTMQGMTPVKGNRPRQGSFLHVGTFYGFQVSERFRFDTSAEVMHDYGSLGFKNAYFAKAGATGSLKLHGPWTLLFPVAQWSAPLAHVNDGRRPGFVLGGGINYHR